jgi:glycosyltransferase involved in cell wall biosynthesis
LPLAVLEAMALGLPVVVSRATNLGELIEGAGCGFVAETDARSVADALRAALTTDPATRAAMGDRGRAAVRVAFSWEHLRERYADLYGVAVPRRP